MINKNTEGLKRKSLQKKNNTSESIKKKVELLEKEVNRRVKKQESMAGLPNSPSSFIKWDVKDICEGEPLKFGRTALYEKHNEKSLDEIKILTDKVKKPPILNSEREYYEYEIEILEVKISNLAEENLRLHGENEELNERMDDFVVQMQEALLEKDSEIQRLKAIVKSQTSYKVTPI